MRAVSLPNSLCFLAPPPDHNVTDSTRPSTTSAALHFFPLSLSRFDRCCDAQTISRFFPRARLILLSNQNGIVFVVVLLTLL